MIDFIATLVDSYEQATGEHPDRIICSHMMQRELVRLVGFLTPDAIRTAGLDLDDVMQVTLYGLQVVPKHDVHPGLIMVCRADDEHGYRPMARRVLGWAE